MVSPAASTSIMLRLREETKERHERAEHGRLPRELFKGRLDRAVYVELLLQLRIVHRSLEEALMQALRTDLRLANVVRSEQFQAALVEADLAYFGVAADQLAATQPLPGTAKLIDEIRAAAATSPVSLLGFHYVLEGAKNGNRFVAKAVRKAYALDGTDGVQSLDPHGDEQPMLWASFKQAMDQLDLAPAERDAIVANAKATFDGIAAMHDEVYDGAAVG